MRLLQRRSFTLLQLQHFALLLASTCAGFTLCKLYFLSQTSREGAADVRWRLFGEAFIRDADSPPEIRSRRNAEHVRLFADHSRDEDRMKDLIEGLESLDVSCYAHQQSERAVEEKYGRFLEVLAIYSAFHAQERSEKSARRLLWVCDAEKACGGLADRIKGVSYALILAMLSRRVLLLDWRDSQFGEQTFLQPNLIDWRLSEEDRKQVYEDAYDINYNAADEEIEADQMKFDGEVDEDEDNSQANEDDDIYSYPVFVHIFSVLGGIGVDIPADELQWGLERIEGKWSWTLLASNMEPSSLTNSTKTASIEWIKQGMTALGLAKLPPTDIDGVVGIVFRYLFKFSHDLLQEVSAARSVLGLSHREYVGVHLRTGFAGSVQQETVNHPKLIRRPLEWDKFLVCAYRYATEKLGSRALIFLATDSNLVKNKTLDVHRFRGRFRSLDNSVVHLDRLEKPPHNIDEFEKEGIMSAWIDLVLLAESHSLVHGESGYSFLAQALCYLPRTRVTKCGLS